MQWYENKQENKDSKINKILKISIIITIIFITVIIALIFILSNNKSNEQSATINGYQHNEIFKLIQYEDLGNNQVKLWIPIKEIAPYFGYKAYNGTYNSATEDKEKCYIITDESSNENTEQTNIKEVANLEANSNIISKLDLTKKDSDYEFWKLEDNVIEKDEVLYTTIEGIKTAFNVAFEYDNEKKQITIFTLPKLVELYKTEIEKGTYPGYKEIDTQRTVNQKAILDGILIVKSGQENGSIKYGAIDIKTKKAILEMKYDEIIYMQSDYKFLINTNKKYGIISENGKTLINPEYDSLKLIDSEKDLYLAMKDNLYGIITGFGREVIYLENEKIGIDIANFEKNEIKNGYILLDKLIPVMKNKKWAFYDIFGNKLSNFEYDEVGYKSEEGNNIYGLLVIPDYKLVVVQKEKKYSVINEEGKANILPFYFDRMYIKIEGGQLKYCMQVNKDEYSISKTLEKIFGKKDNENSTEKNSSINNNTNNNKIDNNTKETNSSQNKKTNNNT